MYIKRLEIENIRSFRPVDITLAKGLNVIAGSNNAGKSTLLKAVYLLQDPFAFRDHDLRINTTQPGVKVTLADSWENRLPRKVG